jgi:hypothetical protein
MSALVKVKWDTCSFLFGILDIAVLVAMKIDPILVRNPVYTETSLSRL